MKSILTRKTDSSQDLNPELADSNPKNLTVHNDKLYFSVTKIQLGEEPWILEPESIACRTKIIFAITGGSTGNGGFFELLNFNKIIILKKKTKRLEPSYAASLIKTRFLIFALFNWS